MATSFWLWYLVRTKRRKVDKLLILTHKKSIIHHSNQTYKWRTLSYILLGSALIMFLGIVAISFEPQLSDMSYGLMTKETGGVLVLLATVIGLAAMIGLYISIKCPQCNLRWFWYGIAKDFKHNIMIGHMNHCPHCNYPENDQHGVGPK